MRKYWPTIAIVAVFAALLGFVVYTYKYKPIEQKKPNILFEADKNKISSVEINSGTRFEIRKDGALRLLVPEEVPSIPTKLAEVFDRSSKIEYAGVISQNEGNLGQFGLASPKSYAKINLIDGTSKAFYIGYQTPTQDGFYVKDENNNTVYKVATEQVAVFTQDVGEYTEKNILSKLDKDKADRLVLDFAGQTKVVERRNGLWYFEGKLLNSPKIENGIIALKNAVVDGVAKKNEYVDINKTPDIRMVFYQSGVQAYNVSIFKKDEKTYNIIKQGTPVQYYMNSENFEKTRSDIVKIFQESLNQ